MEHLAMDASNDGILHGLKRRLGKSKEEKQEDGD